MLRDPPVRMDQVMGAEKACYYWRERTVHDQLALKGLADILE